MTEALLAYIVASTALIWVERRLLNPEHLDPTNDWLSEHIYQPMMRTLVVLIFIVVAYPELFGVNAAPSLTELLRDGRGDLLITSAFVLSLLLPMLPVVDRVPGAVLAAQGILACAMLAYWLGQQLGIAIHLWPGLLVLLQLAAVLVAGRLTARALIFLLPPFKRDTWAPVIGEVARMGSELPAILIYSHFIALQLVDFAKV